MAKDRELKWTSRLMFSGCFVWGVCVVFVVGCAGNQRPEPMAKSAARVELGDVGEVAAARSVPVTAMNESLPRDWQRCPAIAEISSTGDLLVVGDVHGDWEKLRDLLVGAGVIAAPAPSDPAEAAWTAEDATLIFVGDFTGKFSQTLEVVALIWELGRQAKVMGGEVIVMLGNHEAEFLDPDIVDGELVWHKKTATFREELEDEGLDPKDVWLARGNERSRELGEFLNCLPAAAISEHWFFSHAGSTEGRTLDELRQAIEEGVDADGYKTAVLLDEDTGLLEARLSPPDDVWWQKLPESQKKSRKRLQSYAAALGVRHLVVGHQANKYELNRDIVRKKARMFQLFDGTLYLIDVGISRGQKGGLSAGALLHIEREVGEQTVSVVCPDGRRRPLAPEGTSKGLRCKLAGSDARNR